MTIVSVIVAAGHEPDLSTTLRSLAGQDLARSDFEVVVADGGDVPDIAASLVTQYPGLLLRRLGLTGAASCELRRLALQGAQGRYFTFLDAGDTVSPDFLRVLVEATGPTTVGLASVVEVGADERVRDIFRAPSATPVAAVPAAGLPAAFLSDYAKMAPTVAGRAAVSVLDADDHAFWIRLVSRTHLGLGVGPRSTRATYLHRAARAELAGASFEIRVGRQLDAIGALERMLAGTDDDDGVVRAVVEVRTRLINQYLRVHRDQHRRTIEQIRSRGLIGIPYQVLNEGVAQDLAILYMALPHADTSALVAARRIRQAGVLRDVISSDMGGKYAHDPHGALLWREFVDQEFATHTNPQAAWWPGVQDFCRQGMARIEEWELEKGRYRTVYSRAMWPTSHVLAAQYKARNPQVKWIAEFSDPVVRGIFGQARDSHGVPDDAFLAELRTAITSRGLRAPYGDNLNLWVETLAYALGDVLVFTNEHQRDYMLGQVDDDALAARAKRHAVIEYHPTLPAEFYHLQQAEYGLDPTMVNVGYFGVFYATRGLAEVVEAIRTMRPELRARLRLHVFTNKPDDLRAEAESGGVSDVIVANPYVSFLELLNLTTRLDVLLINDYQTRTSHNLNPYVPSKWSDYSGSGTAIWGIVEPGSVLSARDMAYRSELGDVEGARVALERMVTDVAAALA